MLRSSLISLRTYRKKVRKRKITDSKIGDDTPCEVSEESKSRPVIKSKVIQMLDSQPAVMQGGGVRKDPEEEYFRLVIKIQYKQDIECASHKDGLS